MSSSADIASPTQMHQRKRKRDNFEAPTDFIKKTYDMIDKCEPEVACWAEDGDKFIVKDPSTLAKDFFPMYFSHSNYSTFRRQLNFYGFRQINSQQIMNGDFSGEAARHMKFQHEYFRRGQPDLLHKIRSYRTTKGSDHNTQTEIDSLRENVSSLQKSIESATCELDEKIKVMSSRFDKMISLQKTIEKATSKLDEVLVAMSSRFDRMVEETQQMFRNRCVCNCEHNSSPVDKEFDHEKKRQKFVESAATQLIAMHYENKSMPS